MSINLTIKIIASYAGLPKGHAESLRTEDDDRIRDVDTQDHVEMNGDVSSFHDS